MKNKKLKQFFRKALSATLSGMVALTGFAGLIQHNQVSAASEPSSVVVNFHSPATWYRSWRVNYGTYNARNDKGGIISESSGLKDANTGKIMLCVDPAIPTDHGIYNSVIGSAENPQLVNAIGRNPVTLTKEDIKQIGRFFAFRNVSGEGPTQSDKDFLAQIHTWEYINKKAGSFSRYNLANGLTDGIIENHIRKVEEAVTRFDTLPSFNNTTVDVIVGEKKTISDTNSTLDTMHVVAKSGIRMAIKSNGEFDITVDDESLAGQTVTINLDKNIPDGAEVGGVPNYYRGTYQGAPSQILILPRLFEVPQATVTLRIQSAKAYIGVAKKVVEGTDLPISGVKFGIFSDRQTRNKIAEMVTDTDGAAINTENRAIKPNVTYYIRELTKAEGQIDGIIPSNEVYSVTPTNANITEDDPAYIDIPGSETDEIFNRLEQFKARFNKKAISEALNLDFTGVQYKIKTVDLVKPIAGNVAFQKGHFVKKPGSKTEDWVIPVINGEIIIEDSRTIDKRYLETGTYELIEYQAGADGKLATTGAKIIFENKGDGTFGSIQGDNDDDLKIISNNTEGSAVNQQNDLFTALGSTLRATTPNFGNNVWTEAINHGVVKIVKKHAESGQTLAGFQFRVTGRGIYNGNNGYVTEKVYTTNAQGEILTDPLLLGEYTITEAEVPNSFRFVEPNNKVVNVTSMDNETQAVMYEVNNEQQKFDFEIQKDIPLNPTLSKAGAVFEVKVQNLVYPGIEGQKQAGEVVGTYTTDATGLVRLENLPLGTYEIKELTAPQGTVLNTAKLYVTGAYERNGANIPAKSSLVTYDRSEIDGPGAAATQLLKNKLNTVFNSLLPQDQIGTVTYTDAQLGLVAEPSNHPGAFPNMAELGRIEISKHKDTELDIEPGANPIEEGIEFSIKNANGVEVDKIITNYQGKAASKYLPLGTYTVEQLTTTMVNGKPEVRKVKTFNVTLDTDGQVLHYSLENTPRWLRIKVTKVDEKTQKAILQAGVKFQIFNAVTDELVTFEKYPEGVEVDTLDIKELTGDGLTIEKLKTGTYYLKEISGPTGYFFDKDAKIPFEISTEDNQDITPTVEITVGRKTQVVGDVKVNNAPQTGTLNLEKYGDQFTRWEPTTETVKTQDASTIVDKTVEFDATTQLELRVTTKDKTSSESIITDSNGAYNKVVNVAGKYEFLDKDGKVISSIDVINNEPTTISVKLPNTKTVQEVQSGEYVDTNITYNKAIYENRKLAGAKFEFKAKEDVMSFDKQTTLFRAGDRLPIAQKDIEAADGTILYKKGEVIYGKPLSEDQMNNKELVDYFIVTTNEETNLTNIPLGKYTFKEVESPKGFILDSTEREVEFTPQAHTVKVDLKATGKINNERKVLTAKINKKVVEGASDFKGIYFVAKNKTENNGLAAGSIVGYSGISEDGSFSFRDLPAGEYDIQELYTKDGYNLSNAIINVNLDYMDNTDVDDIIIVNETIVNAPTKVDVNIAKANVKGEKLSGVDFKLVNTSNDEIYSKITTDAEGNIRIQLANGTYKLIETKAKPGYVLNNNPTTLAIRDGLPTSFELINEKTYVSIRKVDMATGKYISGVKLKVTHKDGTPVLVDENYHVMYDGSGSPLEWTTTDKALNVYGLEAGQEYLLVEVAAADGYLAAEQPLGFTVNNAHGIQITTLENEPKVDLKTTATVGNDKDKATEATEKVTIWDAVKYTNAIIGKLYKVVGILMDKETNSPLLDADGKQVTSELEFTPTERNGVVNLPFVFNGTHLTKTINVVVFESLYRNGKLVGVHADINDEDQTVTVEKPKVKTTASINGTKDKEGAKVEYAAKVKRLTDKLCYHNLIKGKSYTAVLNWMNKLTGKPFMVDGKPLSTTHEFVAEEADGCEVISTEVESKWFKETVETVAFERVYRDNILVASHVDINDEGQTVKVIVPKMATTATVDGKKSVSPTGKVTIVDRIDVSQMLPGTYNFVTKLMNKSTGEVIIENGKEVMVETTHTIKDGDKFIEVPITVDVSKLAGKKVVVFEYAYDQDGVLVASHADINDEGQTITVKPRVPETNDGIPAYFVTSIVSMLGIAGASIRKSKKDA